MKPIVGEPTGNCYKCPFHRGMINKRKGVKIPGVSGKCVREEGPCDRDEWPKHRDPIDNG